MLPYSILYTLSRNVLLGVDIDINDDDADIGEGQNLIDEEEVDRLRPGNI